MPRRDKVVCTSSVEQEMVSIPWTERISSQIRPSERKFGREGTGIDLLLSAAIDRSLECTKLRIVIVVYMVTVSLRPDIFPLTLPKPNLVFSYILNPIQK